MPDIYVPIVGKGSAKTAQRLVIDPITRIEGHLRIEADLKNGVITDAWSAGTSFRGIEPVLIGRDPRDAWFYTQRICGVCTTSHALTSIRAVENALGISIPDNARLVRNLIAASQFVQDHVMHFYHLHALDWVDVVSALAADANKTGDLQKSISPWPNSSPDYFAGVRTRVKNLVDSGQLGLFANGYWGHPAYALPPEGNLLAVAHYLEALDWQREVIKINAILGGKNPHPQTYLVGGIAIPVDPNSSAAINPSKIAQIRDLVAKSLDFVTQVYLPDLKLIASFYKDWTAQGAGPGNFLAFGEFPMNTGGNPSSLLLPRGVVMNKNVGEAPQALDLTKIKEYIAHSWYSYSSGSAAGLHPSQGETIPNYTGPNPPYETLDVGNQYSWLKAPRYDDQSMEVGPLARMIVAYAAKKPRAVELINGLLSDLGLTAGALFSTLGRVAARGLETQLVTEAMPGWIDELEANMKGGRLTIHDGSKWEPSTWPVDAAGFGLAEAARGALGHWVHFHNGKIDHYQAIVPTTWNGSPRDARGKRGAYEEALIGTRVANPKQPVEILRTIHSFDPCMACSVHLVEADGSTNDVGIDVHIK